MRIDHVIYAAPHLETAVSDLEARLGVRAAGGGQHTGQGTHNRLLALGAMTYLEIIAPDPRQGEPVRPRPYGVDGVEAARFVGWALTCDDIEQARTQARAAGFDPGEVIEGHRLTSTGDMVRYRITSNALTAGVVPFLIGWGDTPHPAASAPAGLVLTSVRVEHPDPSTVLGPLHAVGASVEVRQSAEAALVVGIGGPRGAAVLR